MYSVSRQQYTRVSNFWHGYWDADQQNVADGLFINQVHGF
jgi:hypothetical protein